MNAPSPRNPLWQAHIERLQRICGTTAPAAAQARTQWASMSDGKAEEARLAEWTATPPGRLGRRLFAEIEPYLEFFAIARAG
jgi:hypothetical protein